MPFWSHNSLLSSKDKDGRCHAISFDPTTVKKGQDTLTYDGIRIGEDRDFQRGPTVLAKFTKDKSISSEAWAQREIMKTKIAQEAADKFNNTMKHLIKIQKFDRRQSVAGKHARHQGLEDKRVNRDIEFQIPQTAQVDGVATIDCSIRKAETFLVLKKVSDSQRFICNSKCEKEAKKGKKCSKSWKKSRTFSASAIDLREAKHKAAHKRSISEGEVDVDRVLLCSFEDVSRITDKVHNGQISLQGDNDGNIFIDLPYKQLHSFVHHFFSYHNGEMVIDGLEGEYDEHCGYSLSVPLIHSKSRQFGTHDDGDEGILRVIKNHVCTNLCSHLPKMSLVATTISETRWSHGG